MILVVTHPQITHQKELCKAKLENENWGQKKVIVGILVDNHWLLWQFAQKYSVNNILPTQKTLAIMVICTKGILNNILPTHYGTGRPRITKKNRQHL